MIPWYWAPGSGRWLPEASSPYPELSAKNPELGMPSYRDLSIYEEAHRLGVPIHESRVRLP